MRHFLSIRDLDADLVGHLFRVTADLKARLKARDRVTPLGGRTMALVFEKPSLRTRVTFEVGMVQLGGACVYLASQEIGMGKRESVPDVARNLSRWVDVVTARVFAHRTVDELARHASVPVINGLSDLEQPCQALGQKLSVGEIRFWHILFGVLLGVLFIWRVYLAFFSTFKADWRDFLAFTNIPCMIGQIRFYLLIDKKGPSHEGCYGPLQSLAYLGLMALVLCILITGLILMGAGYSTGITSWAYAVQTR